MYDTMADEKKGHPRAAILREIADEAAVNPKWWKEFEVFWANEWKAAIVPEEISGALKINSQRVRRKPLKRCLYDAEGNCYEFPEPVREEPEYGTKFWAPDPCAATEDIRAKNTWESAPFELRLLKNGMVHLSAEAARAHAIALIRASGGEVEGEDG